MKVILTLKADELKLAQLLSKFAEKYRMTYKLNRKSNGYQLEVELNSDDFGEFIRRLNHLKDATYNIEEMRGGGGAPGPTRCTLRHRECATRRSI